jgi:hypothetical protein
MKKIWASDGYSRVEWLTFYLSTAMSLYLSWLLSHDLFRAIPKPFGPGRLRSPGPVGRSR